MVVRKRDLRVLPAARCGTALAAWWMAMTVAWGSPQSALAADEAAEFAGRVRPLVKTYCLDCHSTKVAKGGLDIERFATLQQVRSDPEPWQSVLEMLQRDEMPPPGKPRPSVEERRSLIGWTRDLLAREAQRRAGDPGPVLLRRLNNSEYRYTIRDLTGVDLRPARQFPADGAAGEGFLNAAEALALSSDRLVKYFDAAKEVAAHAVLLPDGFRFSRSVFREDWVNEVLAEIRALHGSYATELGELPVDRYLRASVTYRDELRMGTASFAQVAKAEGLSPKYLRTLWELLNDQRPSLLLNELRANWRAAEPSDADALAADIYAVQDLLWRKRTPSGAHTLDDRFVPAAVTLADRHTYKLELSDPGEEAVFYLVVQGWTEGENPVRVVLDRPRLESSKAAPLLLRDALQMASKAADTKQGAPPEGVRRLELEAFGRHPNDKPFDSASLALQDAEVLEVRLPAALVAARTLVVDARLDAGQSAGVLARVDVRRTPTAPRVDRGLMWQYREAAAGPPLLVVKTDDGVRKAVADAAAEFCRVFPARVCYPGVIVRDTTVTLERFHRGDGHLSRLLLSASEHQRLDRLWQELHFISRDALQVQESLATLTQGEMTAYEQVQAEVLRRAKRTEEQLRISEPHHLQVLIDLAARAYRRPLGESERESLHALYRALREQKLPHDEAFRSVLARILVSPKFLFRIERRPPGRQPERVSDWELATRLSYFLWSTTPDEPLRQLAGAGRLADPQTLAVQTRRMLRDPRSRALAIEFGTQWLEVRGFDQFQGKDQELYPTFNAPLRRAMYEESILFFQELFRSDRPFRQLLDADYTFLNATLARHYGIEGIEGDAFRRVDGVQASGRGGILGLATVLAKHSGAARTSPVLRGNWIAETLLGERLPRPPDDVPKLPAGETDGARTIRQLVEQHAQLKQCAICHQRIDPLGFALEQFDTIGRRRDVDLGGRPVDAKAQLKDGTRFEGIDGLRGYLLTQRKDDFQRQFCRKLLGYALGRRVILSDRELLKKMIAALDQDQGSLSAAVLVVVRSKQFQTIRGAQFAQTE